MYALRERRVHVTQEDFELAVAKVNKQLLLDGCTCTLLNKALIYMDRPLNSVLL